MEKLRSTSVTTKPKTALPFICKICGAPALYSYYGVISCYACKIFFKRNAQNKQMKFKCDFNDQCEINVTNRHICGSCRLEKCLGNGMKPELIRSSIPKKIPRIFLSQKLFNNNQSILIENLINSYDQSKLLEIIQQFINQHNQSEPINKILAKQLIENFYQITGIYLRTNKDILTLPSNDRAILIHTAAENITSLGANFILFTSKLMSNEKFCNYVKNIYQRDTITYYRSLNKFIQSDPTIFKLALALFAFSLNSRTLNSNGSLTEFNDFKKILKIENKYAELTWTYLNQKLDYHQAIKTFMNLIQWFIALTVFISLTDNDQIHRNYIQALIEQTELVLILDDYDELIN